jgi:hypothetical protein
LRLRFDLLDEFENLSLDGDVQRRCLVRRDQQFAGTDSAMQSSPLPHASGKFVGIVVDATAHRNADQAEHFQSSSAGLTVKNAPCNSVTSISCREIA